MICVDKYFDNGLHFTCTKCDKQVDLNFDKPVEDNSVEAIDLECPYCGDDGVVLVLKCKDEYMANSLMAKLEGLKEKYYGGDS